MIEKEEDNNGKESINDDISDDDNGVSSSNNDNNDRSNNDDNNDSSNTNTNTTNADDNHINAALNSNTKITKTTTEQHPVQPPSEEGSDGKPSQNRTSLQINQRRVDRSQLAKTAKRDGDDETDDGPQFYESDDENNNRERDDGEYIIDDDDSRLIYHDDDADYYEMQAVVTSSAVQPQRRNAHRNSMASMSSTGRRSGMYRNSMASTTATRRRSTNARITTEETADDSTEDEGVAFMRPPIANLGASLAAANSGAEAPRLFSLPNASRSNLPFLAVTATLAPGEISLPPDHTEVVRRAWQRITANAQHAEEVPQSELAQQSDRNPEPVRVHRKITMMTQFSVFLLVLIAAAVGAGALYLTRCDRNPDANGCISSDPPVETDRSVRTASGIGPVCEQAIAIDDYDVDHNSTTRNVEFSLLLVAEEWEETGDGEEEENSISIITCLHPDLSSTHVPALFTGYQAWFTLLGTGTPIAVTLNASSTFVSASTPSTSTFDVWIVAYAYTSTDEGGCDDIMAGDQPVCMAKRRCSKGECSLTFATTANEEYKIVIGGTDAHNFHLDVRETMANDVCPGALSIATEDAVDLNVGLVVSGSNTNATDDASDSGLPCLFEGPGSWHSITGTGMPLMASTCKNHQPSNGSEGGNEEELQLGGSANVAVLVGDCFSLQCAAGAAYVACGSGNQVTWPTQKGEYYYLVVTSSNKARDESSVPEQAVQDRQGIRGSSIAAITTTPNSSSRSSVVGSSMAASLHNFKLKIRETVGNDICHTAESTDLGTKFDKIDGTNVHASSDSMPTCGSESELDLDPGMNMNATSMVGTWWKVEGTGMLIRASTCLAINMDGSNDNTVGVFARVQVFKGSCDELACIDTDMNAKTDNNAGGTEQRQRAHQQLSKVYHRACDLDDSHGLSEVAWLSEVGMQYFILVSTEVAAESKDSLNMTTTIPTAIPSPVSSALQTSTLPSSSLSVTTNIGFEMTIQSVASNDICESAIPLNPAGNTTIFGNTWNATIPTNFVSACGDANAVIAPGVWYSLIGKGTYVTIEDVCNLDEQSDLLTEPDRFFNQITVMSGDCNELQCVTGNKGSNTRCAAATWFTREDQQYHILIHGLRLEKGDFCLSVSEVDGITQIGGSCAVAKGPLEVGSYTHINMIEPPQLATIGCGFSTTGSASWLTLKGNGRRLVATTCDWVFFDTRLILFKGDACGSLQCMSADYGICDDGRYQSSHVEFDSETDVLYYILIHGVGQEGQGQKGGTTQLVIAEVKQNEECDEAQTLVINGEPMGGAMQGVRPQKIQHCSDGLEISAELGVWYTVTATEKSQLSIQLCSIDKASKMMLGIYSGQCGETTCVDGTIYHGYRWSCDPDSDSLHHSSSNLNWIAEASESFLIFVGGRIFDGGKFQISVAGLSIVDNDDCNTAAPISFNERVSESFQRVTGDSAPSPCNETYTLAAWYSIRGTGQRMTASTCDGHLASQSHVTVASGDCGSLACIDSNSGFCGKNSQVSWESEEGTLYYISVATEGFSMDTFTLIVNGDDMPVPLPAYDECDGATRLQIDDGIMVEVSTQLASMDEVVGCGGSEGQTIGGIWSVIEGNGSILKLSAHPSSRQSRPNLAVFQNTCDSLVCVEGNSQRSVANSYFVTWFAEEGVEYHVLVFDAFPSISLSAESVKNGAQPRCKDMEMGTSSMAGQTALIGMEDSIIGTTGGGTEDFVDPCGNELLPMGAWLSFVGTGERVRASMQHDNTDFIAAMNVYEGDNCATLVCTATVEDAQAKYTSVDWTSEPGKIYRIYVHGVDKKAGVFELSMLPLVHEDVCAGAIPLLPGMEVQLEDSGMLGPDTTGTACDASLQLSDAPGIWFRVVGTGKTLVASTCNPDDWLPFAHDTHMSVFRGDCGSLECIDFNDDYCEDHSRVIWQSEVGRSYFVLVRIQKNRNEFYRLTLSELVESQSCELSALQPVETDKEMTSRFSPFNQEDTVLVCGNDHSVGTGGGWITAIGTGLYMMATTCGADTRFNSTVMVYTGDGEDCNDMQCVDSAAQTACGAWLKEGSVSLDYEDSDGAAAVHQGSVTWSSILGEVYYVHVSTSTDGQGNTDVGVDADGVTHDNSIADTNADTDADADTMLFSLEVKNVADNDVCQHAPLLNPGDFKVDFFDTATIDYDYEICNKPYFPNDPLAPPESPGVWYRMSLESPVEGNAGVAGVRLRSCQGRNDNDLGRLTIYGGTSCDEMECLNTFRVQEDCVSVDLTPDLGTDFFILIHQSYRLAPSHSKLSVEAI